MSKLLTAHADEIVASVAGVGTTLSLAASHPVDVSDPSSFLAYIPALVGPTLVVVINRLFAMRGAKKRARAKFLREEGEAMRHDSDPTNDGAAREKLLEAAELEAEADAMERRE